MGLTPVSRWRSIAVAKTIENRTISALLAAILRVRKRKEV